MQDDYPYGRCPDCDPDEPVDYTYLNVHRKHWFICDKHKNRWCFGSNLFSSWVHETEDEWRRNAEFLSAYKEVKPAFPAPPYENEQHRNVAVHLRRHFDRFKKAVAEFELECVPIDECHCIRCECHREALRAANATLTRLAEALGVIDYDPTSLGGWL